MYKSFSSSRSTTARLLYISNMQSSHILPISIKNPPPPPSSAIERAGSVFLSSNDHDDVHLLIEDKPFVPTVTSSSSFQQQRRRRAASDSNLMGFDHAGFGRRRFFWTDSGRVDGERSVVVRVGSKMLSYIGSGYRIFTGFLSLQCYAFLIMPGVLQVAYYYYFSSQIRRDIVFGDQPRNKLDIYLPENDGKNNGPRPVIAFITGGAWVIGPSLQSIPGLPKQIESYEVCVSFAYDSSTDDYKVVMGIKKKIVYEALVQVLSLKSNTWKLIGHINYWFQYGKPGVFLNGALHWFAYHGKTKYNFISGTPTVLLSFDLSREEFKEIPKPDDFLGSWTTLGIFEDNLCISCEDGGTSYYRICVMRNYNVKKSWEFLPNDYKMRTHDAVRYMKIYYCTSPKKKMMTFYCDDETVLSRSGKHIIDTPIFVQSLLSPYINSERPSHAGSAKVAERECHQMRVFERRKKYYWMQSNELSRIREVYWREGGQNEKSYLREGGETKRKKRQRRDVNIMSKEKRAIAEILTKEEKGGGKNTRKRNK